MSLGPRPPVVGQGLAKGNRVGHSDGRPKGVEDLVAFREADFTPDLSNPLIANLFAFHLSSLTTNLLG
jgi:hypothetical protein